jgi:pilus assembly protein CpaF
MELEIQIESDDGEQYTERVDASGPVSFGRSSQCTICLESDLLSRQHVIIEALPNGLRVEDTSTNGTMAGDQLLRRTSIDVPFGTPIVAGDFTLTIRPTGMVALPPMPPPPRHAAPIPAARVIVGPTAPLPPIPAPMAPMPPPMAPMPRPPMGVAPMPAPMAPRMPAVRAPAPMPGPPPGVGGMPMPTPPGVTASVPLAMPTPPGVTVSAPPKAPAADIEPEVAKAAIAADVALRREVHRQLLENLDLATMDPSKFDDPSLRPKVLGALRRIIKVVEDRIPANIDRDKLVGELADEALGLGPLERFLADPTITEIMVVDPDTIFVEKAGKLTKADARFTDDERVRAVIERIVTPLGRRIDESSPLVDARLKDGSRVNAVIRPIALKGSCITIRKFSRTPLTLEKLISFGALTSDIGRFLTRSVIAKKNIVISGGTGSGKTTLLNVLSAAIPPDERIVTIEDAAELQLKQPHVVSMETRPANMEGKGEYNIRDLVRNALRMRPDRIVVGECRGGEALDMLQAMNTGHDGSLTTTHANSPEEALARLETLVLMAGVDLPSRAIREQIANSVHVIVQISRFADGSRKLKAVTEVVGIDEEGNIELVPIYQYVRTGTGPNGKVLGDFKATGYLPSYLDQFIIMGLVRKGEPYL